MRLTAYKDLTRLEQTLFGLPLCLAGGLLGEANLSVRWLWIFPAFLMARISGMAFNQLIDRYIDAKNPRTENRAIPSGRITENQARVVAWGGLTLFLVVCYQINTPCLLLAPFAALLLILYSYMKRVTAACHFVLGAIHFLSPVMASVAITGSLHLPAILVGLAAACLISGNDIVYAIQDYDFDTKENLFSLPSRYGVEKSLSIARLMHVCCLIILFGVGVTARLPVFYYLLIPLTALCFYRFHKRVGNKISEPLFFSCNVVVAFSIFGFILASFIWDVL